MSQSCECVIGGSVREYRRGMNNESGCQEPGAESTVESNYKLSGVQSGTTQNNTPAITL